MWFDGKEVKVEMVEADKARSIYTDIVRRMKDAGQHVYVERDRLTLREEAGPPGQGPATLLRPWQEGRGPAGHVSSARRRLGRALPDADLGARRAGPEAGAAARRGAGAGHLRQHERAEDGAGAKGAE